MVCGFCVVFLSRSPVASVLSSFCVVVVAFTFEVSGQEMGGDSFQTQKRKSWIPGQIRAEKVLADATANDGRKEWFCKFCCETKFSTRWRCRRCYSNIPAGLQVKYRQAMSAKTRGWSSRSSSSSGGEGKKCRDQDAEIKELRAQNEQLRRQQRVEKGMECKVIRREEKAVLRKTGTWRLMRRRAEEEVAEAAGKLQEIEEK